MVTQADVRMKWCSSNVLHKNIIPNSILFQFIIEPNNLEKDIKLQLPIMMATYPYRNTDGTLKKKKGAQYPSNLPIFRPWLEEKTFE